MLRVVGLFKCDCVFEDLTVRVWLRIRKVHRIRVMFKLNLKNQSVVVLSFFLLDWFIQYSF